ncbi:hypothetical protein NC651_009628 [Populus alba x Populus x berolinensis]|nr:hypothetical protein NC651_009628 [Populus alba x Populus x berolinensis]
MLLLPFMAAAQTNGTVPVGASITATDDSPSWLSASGEFAFGFRQLENKDYFLLSIWYEKIPEKTVVWYAIGEDPTDDPAVPRGSKVELTDDRGLLLAGPQGNLIWTSRILIGAVSSGVMNDTGNFVLQKRNSDRLWESFNNPTDTLLPTQIMEVGGVVSSRRTETNFSLGRFQLRLLDNGNLVLNSMNSPTKLAYDDYYRSGTSDASNSSNSGYRLILNESGYMYILRRNGLSWSPVRSEPENICKFNSVWGSGACGYNSICSLSVDRRPNCTCPQEFSLLDQNDKHGSCVPNFEISCKDDGKNSSEDLYDFVELRYVDYPSGDAEHLQPQNEDQCRKACLNDCLCGAVIFLGNNCWKKKLPLSNGKVDSGFNGKTFIKFKKGHIPPGNPGQENNVESNLRSFTYKELTEATEGFQDELGRGAFGGVYKGAIKTGFTNFIAVKKLDGVVEHGEKEFKTEVNVISQTHHKNLVRLLGFCDEGQHRLLVYEFLSNGTLADFLFGSLRPSWKQRTQITFGIARGLLYLHEECSTQIIHCDIKPQNILIDDYYNARISDFGLAKLLAINQSQTKTAIRGTKGYVAPEWFRNTPVTVKVDVYSFGVLLLEIICCRRSVDLEISGTGAILTDWAYDCYRHGTLDALIEDDMEAMNDVSTLERAMKVAIWCIQEVPSLRPTMRKVTQMLEGVVEVPAPPNPFPFSEISSS